MRALHELNRLREAMQLIAELAAHPERPGVLNEIARLARCALDGWTPASDDAGPDTDHA